MPCPPDTAALWLVPVVAMLGSGTFAIAVLWLGHFFTARREQTKAAADREQARKAFLREQLELLVTLGDQDQDSLTDHSNHIAAMGVHVAAGLAIPEEKVAAVGMFDRALAIATLYFPGLAGATVQLDAGRLALMQFVSGEVDAIVRDATAWGATRLNFTTRSAGVVSELASARARLVREARQMIEGELAF